MRRRIDWVAVDKKIRGFLAREVSLLEVRRWARYMITTPKQIAKHTGFSVRTVKAHLLRIADRRVDGKVVIVKVNKTDVIVKLAG